MQCELLRHPVSIAEGSVWCTQSFEMVQWELNLYETMWVTKSSCTSAHFLCFAACSSQLLKKYVQYMGSHPQVKIPTSSGTLPSKWLLQSAFPLSWAYCHPSTILRHRHPLNHSICIPLTQIIGMPRFWCKVVLFMFNCGTRCWKRRADLEDSDNFTVFWRDDKGISITSELNAHNMLAFQSY